MSCQIGEPRLDRGGIMGAMLGATSPTSRAEKVPERVSGRETCVIVQVVNSILIFQSAYQCPISLQRFG